MRLVLNAETQIQFWQLESWNKFLVSSNFQVLAHNTDSTAFLGYYCEFQSGYFGPDLGRPSLLFCCSLRVHSDSGGKGDTSSQCENGRDNGGAGASESPREAFVEAAHSGRAPIMRRSPAGDALVHSMLGVAPVPSPFRSGKQFRHKSAQQTTAHSHGRAHLCRRGPHR